MPAQPPFFTPTRTPANGLSAFAMIALMRSAAASVSRITWGRGRALAISLLPSRFFQTVIMSGESQDTRNALPVYLGVTLCRRNLLVAPTSPHVQRGARLVRHPALIPGRIPHDIHRHRPDAGDARYRVLDHHRQLLRRGTVGRGE